MSLKQNNPNKETEQYVLWDEIPAMKKYPKSAKRANRSLELIAEFKDGYAKNWYFAVGECFKDELDIKYTQRIEKIKINGKIQYEEVLDKNGKLKKKAKTKKVRRWTQGTSYSFAEGHVIYDVPKVYLPWREALHHIKLACHVIRATPGRFNDENQFIDGAVTFKLSKPNDNKSGLKTISQYTLTQTDFVYYLKTGILPLLQHH